MSKGKKKASLRKRISRRLRKGVAAFLQCFFLGLGLLFIPMLSRKAAKRLGAFIGWFVRSIRGPSYRAARENLALVYAGKLSEAEQKALLKRNFRHLGMVVVDYFWFSRNAHKRILEYCEYGDETMKRWVEGDFPGVFVTAHFGNWELGGHFIAEKGRRLWSVFRPIGSKLVVRWLKLFRQESSQRIIMREGAMAGIMRALRAKDVVAMVLDQHVEIPEGGVYLAFLGLPATIAGGVGVLAHRLGVPIIVVGIVHDEARDRYVCTTISELRAEQVRSMEPTEITKCLRDGMEKMILTWPEQWMWPYRRWKRYQRPSDKARYPSYARLDIYSPYKDEPETGDAM